MKKVILVDTAITQYKTFADTDIKLATRIKQIVYGIENNLIQAVQVRTEKGRIAYRYTFSVFGRDDIYVMVWYEQDTNPRTAFITNIIHIPMTR